MFGPSTHSLFVYSDVDGSRVLGDQLTDFICEVNYKHEGKGTHYFKPTHMQYIPLRKELLDKIYSTAWKYLPIYQGFAAADLQINTAFLPRQRRGMPKFYRGFA